ncbi:phosphoethanolamine transferase [Entomomonas sp. E2T0]|uniref:phosphoethanolamine transferase n=1 Tax=Entomomonas sp. E2T0 TaxID=2930213 RepID=UPI002228157B|nr:phosphoethanolamine transferase [Entomomonas sp. E2T0]UYZ84584.1 phosphoethanolamine transferase [Entomomonas sp. E2T0]
MQNIKTILQYDFVPFDFIKKVKWLLTTCITLTFILFYFMDVVVITDLIANISIVSWLIVATSRLKILNILIIFLFSTIMALEIAYVIENSERISLVILESVIDTNIVYGIFVAKIILLISIPITVLLCFLFIKSVSEIKKFSFKKQIIFAFILFAISIADVSSRIHSIYNTFDERGKEDFSTIPLIMLAPTMQIFYPFILGDSFCLVSYINEVRKINTNIHHTAWPEGIKLSYTKETPLKIVVILGETALRQHFSLYGYEFPTTPNLNNLYKNNEITVFQNVISGAPITRESIRLSLSYATPHNKNNFYNYKNIVEMAHIANYETLWFSTTHETAVYSNYVGMIAKSSNIFYDSNSHDLLGTEEDLVLPELLDKHYETGKKQFFVLHMQGSHMDYLERFDKKDKEALTTTPENTNYDRTIHHTDRVLLKIVDVIRKHDENTVMIFISDHGEIINKGHGMVFGGGALQYEIPFITLQNKNKLNIESLIDAYRSNNNILNTINLNYILLEIIGFDIDNHLIEQSK